MKSAPELHLRLQRKGSKKALISSDLDCIHNFPGLYIHPGMQYLQRDDRLCFL